MCIPLCIKDILLSIKQIFQPHVEYTNFYQPSFFFCALIKFRFHHCLHLLCHYTYNLSFNLSILFTVVQDRRLQMAGFPLTLIQVSTCFRPHDGSWKERQLEFKQPKVTCDWTVGILILKPRNSFKIHQF